MLKIKTFCLYYGTVYVNRVIQILVLKECAALETGYSSGHVIMHMCVCVCVCVHIHACTYFLDPFVWW